MLITKGLSSGSLGLVSSLGLSYSRKLLYPSPCLSAWIISSHACRLSYLQSLETNEVCFRFLFVIVNHLWFCLPPWSIFSRVCHPSLPLASRACHWKYSLVLKWIISCGAMSPAELRKRLDFWSLPQRFVGPACHHKLLNHPFDACRNLLVGSLYLDSDCSTSNPFQSLSVNMLVIKIHPQSWLFRILLSSCCF